LRKIAALVMLALMAFPSLSKAVVAASLTVDTDSESYAPWEEVEIFGTADPNVNVTIIVISTMEIIYNITVSADEDGEYSTKVAFLEDASEGLYDVAASTNGATAQTSFMVTQADIFEEDMVETSDEETVLEVTENAMSLKAAIERAYDFICKIEATVERLKEEGYEVQDFEAYLIEAKTHLEEALTRAFNLFDIDAANQELLKARGILDQTMVLLHSTAKIEVKAKKAERFLQQVENRINSLEEKIDKLQHRLEKGQPVLAALRSTKMKLMRIRERLVAGNVEDAVDELSDAVEEIEESVDELNGGGISVILKGMNHIEAKMHVLNATAKRLRKKGLDTSEVEEELQSAKALLEEMMTLLEEGDTEAAEELLEEVKEHLEEIQEVTHGKNRSKNVEKTKKGVEKAKK